MASRIVLVAVLTCLSIFGLRGMLPEITQNSSLSFFTDLLLMVAAIVLAGVALYEATATTDTSDAKLKKTYES